MAKKLKITEEQLKRLVIAKDQISENVQNVNQEIELNESIELSSEEHSIDNQLIESIKNNFKRFL